MSSPVTVVTGSNSGIGRATAVHLASQGHQVYGTLRNPDSAGKLKAMADEAGVEVHLVQMDVASDQSVTDGFAQILQQAGRVDNVVNNAGVGGNGVTEECSIELYEDVMNVNLYGALRCIHAVLPGMRERRSGAIVNISSVVGRFCHIGQSPYYISKWAMEAMSEGLAQEVARIVHEANTTDQPKLRYACSWGGSEVIAGRERMSDEEWVALGAHEDDADYYADFERHFGVDIAPKG
jgi:NAD(P)-dependent dehydrogenase (short-subunit alcohol dehydrogenase family)